MLSSFADVHTRRHILLLIAFHSTPPMIRYAAVFIFFHPLFILALRDVAIDATLFSPPAFQRAATR